MFTILGCALSSPAYAALNIPITVNLSETVNVTGTPRIAVDVGGTTRYATYSSGTGSNTLTFTLAPQAGDVDLDGVTVSSPIDLNGGTIKDVKGNNAALTFTPPSTANVKVNYPSLGMDFVYDADGRYTLNGTAYNDLSSFLTAAGGSFTRASIGTYFDSTGTLQTAASGVPRFDYDPVTHAAKGILIEESRTNLLKYSEDLDNALWIKTNTSVTMNTQVSPNGTLTADTILEDSTTNNHYIYSSTYNWTSGVLYTFSVYLKAGSSQWVQIPINLPYFGANAWANFDLINGVVGNKGSSATASITPANNGWYRCVVKAAATNSGTGTGLQIALTNNSNTSSRLPTYLGSSGYIYAWGGQAEQGSFATSYIPTTTAAVTRAADNLTIPTGGWYNPTSGSLYARETVPESINSSASNTFVSLDDGSTSNFITSRVLTNFSTELAVKVSGSNQVNRSSIFTSAYTPLKLGLSFSVNNFSFSADGSPTVNATSGSMPTITQLQIGRVGTTNYINNTVTSTKYYPARVTDTQLQLLTQ